MRCRLHVRYRKAGVLYPAGAVIEAEEEDLSILGSLAEAIEEAAPIPEQPPHKPAPEPDQPGPGAGEPQGGEDASLRGVLGEMDAADPQRKNKSWWTWKGKPEVSELRRRGHVLSAAERDIAWAEHKAKQ